MVSNDFNLASPLLSFRGRRPILYCQAAIHSAFSPGSTTYSHIAPVISSSMARSGTSTPELRVTEPEICRPCIFRPAAKAAEKSRSNSQ